MYMMRKAILAPVKRAIHFLNRGKNALRYIYRGDSKGFLDRLKFYWRQKKTQKPYSRLATSKGDVWGILTTPHTFYIAKIIAERLEKRGIASEIITECPNIFDHNFYIILCAQMFKKLPPPERRIIYQLEQSISSRWFTPEYINTLKSSLAVFEYSLTNIEFLAEKSITYPQVIYLPIGTPLKAPEILPATEKKYDFIFYGDNISSPRRRKFLQKLQSQFSVKICNNCFGDEMAEHIRYARAVINIHYYENALLEVPRIQECISLGVPILSESTIDQQDYPELNGAVRFFRQDSESHMLECAALMLNETLDTSDELRKSAVSSAQKFTFMFDRALTSLGILPATTILENPVYLENKSDFIGLSLPETIKRRKVFSSSKPDGCIMFDGIRNIRGWVGCGSSFSALARYALAHNIDQLTVIEDDVLLPVSFDENMLTVKKYLRNTVANWDIFSGMMASVHQTAQVINVEKLDGLTFVTLDRMTSTVCNIYNTRALDILSRWNPMDLNVDDNTIDRYLERQPDLRVVVALPFIAGHREEAESTLWGFDNTRYAQMIADAESQINELAHKWLLNLK